MRRSSVSPDLVCAPVPLSSTVRSSPVAFSGVVKVAVCFVPKSPLTFTPSLVLPDGYLVHPLASFVGEALAELLSGFDDVLSLLSLPQDASTKVEAARRA